jgi:hypothetical protein
VRGPEGRLDSLLGWNKYLGKGLRSNQGLEITTHFALSEVITEVQKAGMAVGLWMWFYVSSAQVY